MVNQPFQLTLSRHVYIGDDDASGLIYFASYFRYMAEADQDFFRAIGRPLTESIQEGTSCPCVSADCSFIRPARAGDDLEQHVSLITGRRTSFTMIHEFMKDGELVAKGRLVRVWTNLETMKPTVMPEWIHIIAAQPGSEN